MIRLASCLFGPALLACATGLVEAVGLTRQINKGSQPTERQLVEAVGSLLALTLCSIGAIGLAMWLLRQELHLELLLASTLLSFLTRLSFWLRRTLFP